MQMDLILLFLIKLVDLIVLIILWILTQEDGTIIVNQNLD